MLLYSPDQLDAFEQQPEESNVLTTNLVEEIADEVRTLVLRGVTETDAFHEVALGLHLSPKSKEEMKALHDAVTELNLNRIIEVAKTRGKKAVPTHSESTHPRGWLGELEDKQD